MKVIKRFLFDKAQYRLEDGWGNTILLAVDYKNGRFDLVNVTLGNIGIGDLRDEAGRVAHSLIKKKRGVNFSDNIKV